MLSDTALRHLKPATKAYKVADRDGLYVVVLPSGGISFRFNYALNGRQETVVFGRYGPGGLSLKDARERLYEAKKLIATGQSPARRKSALTEQQRESQTFGEWAEEWLDRYDMAESTRAPSHISESRRYALPGTPSYDPRARWRPRPSAALGALCTSAPCALHVTARFTLVSMERLAMPSYTHDYARLTGGRRESNCVRHLRAESFGWASGQTRRFACSGIVAIAVFPISNQPIRNQCQPRDHRRNPEVNIEDVVAQRASQQRDDQPYQGVNKSLHYGHSHVAAPAAPPIPRFAPTAFIPRLVRPAAA